MTYIKDAYLGGDKPSLVAPRAVLPRSVLSLYQNKSIWLCYNDLYFVFTKSNQYGCATTLCTTLLLAVLFLYQTIYQYGCAITLSAICTKPNQYGYSNIHTGCAIIPARSAGITCLSWTGNECWTACTSSWLNYEAIRYYRVFIKYCVFSEDFKIFRTLAFLCSPSVSVCVHTQGR